MIIIADKSAGDGQQILNHVGLVANDDALQQADISGLELDQFPVSLQENAVSRVLVPEVNLSLTDADFRVLPADGRRGDQDMPLPPEDE